MNNMFEIYTNPNTGVQSIVSEDVKKNADELNNFITTVNEVTGKNWKLTSSEDHMAELDSRCEKTPTTGAFWSSKPEWNPCTEFINYSQNREEFALGRVRLIL